jgi:hypothetical protein
VPTPSSLPHSTVTEDDLGFFLGWRRPFPQPRNADPLIEETSRLFAGLLCSLGPQVEVLRSLAGVGERAHKSGVGGWSGPGRRQCALGAPGMFRGAGVGRCRAGGAVLVVAGQVMTTVSGRRQRRGVSLSAPGVSGALGEQLSRVSEILDRVNRTLPRRTVTGREELSALGGLLTEISGGLVTLTNLLSASAHHYDRTQVPRAGTDTTASEHRPAPFGLLRDCQDACAAAHAAARAFHAELRHGLPRPTAHDTDEAPDGNGL